MASTSFLATTFVEDYDPILSSARHIQPTYFPRNSTVRSSDTLLQPAMDSFLTLVERWADAKDEYPLVFAWLQYWALTAHALAILLWNSVLTVAQSFAWIATAEGLQWIQTSGADSNLDWEVLLLGSVFLLLDIDIDSIDQKRYPMLLSTASAPPTQTETSPLHRQPPYKKTSGSSSSVISSSSSASSSSASSSKRVTFHSRVMVIGGGKAAPRPSIDIDRVIPAVPLTESPTRSTFSWDDETIFPESHLDAFGPAANSVQTPSPVLSDLGALFRSPSPCPSISNSCRSSICSELSDSSSDASNDSTSDQRPRQRTKKSTTSKIASFFHKNDKHKQQQRVAAALQSIDLGECANCPTLLMPLSPEDQYQPTHRRSSVLHKLGMRLRRSS
ncbi:hypothetical protein BGW38_010919 [Lunasporangiospora selenospora]|uniref:Uncharacterized protein n=1 Tax=Lunasporangiospora selenospora TaxID=979761 RepID=A0A9P6FXS0_9FUNG|nr:hypothetical protein BGW38_010919 [Lunasporangiospora selenospora]